MKRRDVLVRLAATMSSGLACVHAGAQPTTGDGWPSRPIKLILPFAPGGPTDAVARLVAVRLAERLGQPVAVENREGGGGIIAAEAVMRAPADGYTLLFHTSGIAILPAIHRNLRFDPVKNLEPVGMVSTIPMVLLVNNSLPANTPAEFFEYLRQNQGKLNYGSGGVGNATHVGMEQILQATRTSAVHVAFRGTAPSMVALIGGQVQFMSDSLITALPQIQAGRVRPIAILTKTRVASLPNVPTLSETVIPGMDQSAWQGIWAPPGTSPAIVTAANAALNAVLNEPAVRSQLEKGNVAIRTSSPAELGAFLAADIDRWKAVAQYAKIVVD